MGQVVAVSDDEGDHELNQLPDVFAVHQNYPNPFNPETKIEFDLPRTSLVKLEVFNTLGRLVRMLIDEQMSAGCQTVSGTASTTKVTRSRPVCISID